MSDETDDDEPEIGLDALRPEALAALREVMATDRAEDFGLSQFWYTDACSDRFAYALRKSAPKARIAVLSCPSIYDALLRRDPNDASVLFEFDTKFKQTAKHFVFFDFNLDPSDTSLARAFDFVIIDPPYVSKDCLSAFFDHARFLAKNTQVPMLAFTSIVNRTFLLEDSQLQLRLTHASLDFTTKLATPLRAFTNLETLGLALDGFDLDDP